MDTKRSNEHVPLRRMEAGKPVAWLTRGQIQRIKRYKAILAEVEPSSIEETLDDFRRDRHPDTEIAVWEHIASVYEAEVKLRPNADRAERELLFKVIFQCSLSASLTDIALAVPMASELPQLQRVIQRFQLRISPK